MTERAVDPATEQALLARVRQALGPLEPVEKKMFGGRVFMVRDHMTVAVSPRGLLARIGPEAAAEAIARPDVVLMANAARSYPGYVVIGPTGFAADADLARWLDLALGFVGRLPPKARR